MKNIYIKSINNIIFNIFLLQLFIISVYSYSSSLYKNIDYFQKLNFYNDLKKYYLVKDKSPVILDGIKTDFKQNTCSIFCDINDIKFKLYSFDNFILKRPHLIYENSMIYVHDYLIGNGRILNEYEKEAMYSLPETSNMVFLQTDNINTIAFKDLYLNKKFKILNFPTISKKEYIRYIYSVINYFKYNDDLLLLNWNYYNIEILDFEKINILLFELNKMLNENLTLKDLHHYMEHIIVGLTDY